MALRIANKYIYHFELGFVVAVILTYFYKSPVIGIASTIGLAVLVKLYVVVVCNNNTFGRFIAVTLGSLVGGVSACLAC